MVKFTDTKIVFQEIPDQITLAINISGCPCACEGCHSSFLAEDVGEELTCATLAQLISRHDMASCICFMGGDRDPGYISQLAGYLREVAPTLLVGWYSGRDELAEEVELQNFDYIKIGSYQSKYGALDSPTTNQRLYKINHTSLEMEDITPLMRRVGKI